ncbi:hypothetical protein [Hansschlegelia plantiphila]|uniref:Uncharacterized protein n=1 Tax=Hansschlegelia plantiphila TaxID=374655 RepID=A0A9W6J046_9HYPH|nr:hypothetical protein [Hansschlegelia plantiphila]GLK67897.1 hypothetical protein GCM10008179_15350 [Hansschlegelia plantiphila]
MTTDPKTRRKPIGEAARELARRLYETSLTPQTEIAARVGVSPQSLCRLAKKHSWERCSGAGRAETVRRIRARVDQHIERVEAVLTETGSETAGPAIDAAERAARTLASLVRTLRELQKYDADQARGATEADDADGAPADLDALRDALADRLARIQAAGE